MAGRGEGPQNLNSKGLLARGKMAGSRIWGPPEGSHVKGQALRDHKLARILQVRSFYFMLSVLVVLDFGATSCKVHTCLTSTELGAPYASLSIPPPTYDQLI